MDFKAIDSIFPYLVFTYATFMLLVIENPWLRARLETQKVKNEALLRAWHELQKKRLFAYVLFFVGGLWSLQNLWF